MISDLNITDIETTDIKASFKVSQIIWALLDAVSAGDDEDDELNFYDKELLEEVLRFGTIAEVARLKKVDYVNLRNRVTKILYCLSNKIEQVRSQKEEIQSLKERLDFYKIDIMEYKLSRLEERIAAKDRRYAKLNEKLDLTEKKLDRAMALIKTLRKQKGEDYKALYEVALETIERQREENRAFEDFLNYIESEPLNKSGRKQSYQVRKLKSRIASLEKRIQDYKTQGISAILDFTPEMISVTK